MNRYVILDNVRSAHNVGAIFRTADGAGITKIYLCGYTPRPIDRFGREQAEIAKTSLGAHKTVVWEAADDISDIISRLKAEGVVIATIEQTYTSIDYRTWESSVDVAFVFGNEVDGVQPAVSEISDVVLELPMLGSKESLNVSTTAGIILYHFLPDQG